MIASLYKSIAFSAVMSHFSMVRVRISRFLISKT